MSRRLHLGADAFDLLEAHETGRADPVLEFDDPAAAALFVRRLCRDPANIDVLRAAVARWRPASSVMRLGHEQLVQTVVALLASRTLRIERSAERIQVDLRPIPAQAAAAPAPAPQPRDDVWIEFRVIDDETGEAYPDVKLEITLPDESTRTKSTDGDGIVELPGITPGSAEVTSEVPDASLEQTFAFVGMGNPPSPDEEAEREQLPGGPYQIRQVDEHRVRSGETLEGLAKAAGMSWQELAKFNWGTDTPSEINKHLRFEVGCTKKDGSGHNYRFDDEDRPGMVFIPKPWSRSGLATELSHTFRVRRVRRVLAIRLDDPFLGFLAETDVEVGYADGSSESLTTDEDGVVEVQTDRFSDDGNYADLEFKTELREHQSRVFLVLEHPSSRNGAWQRLVNLGYVELDEPKCEPENDDLFAAALEEFQADRGLRPTGELDAQTCDALASWNVASSSWGEHGRSLLDDPDDEETRSKDQVA